MNLFPEEGLVPAAAKKAYPYARGFGNVMLGPGAVAQQGMGMVANNLGLTSLAGAAAGQLPPPSTMLQGGKDAVVDAGNLLGRAGMQVGQGIATAAPQAFDAYGNLLGDATQALFGAQPIPNAPAAGPMEMPIGNAPPAGPMNLPIQNAPPAGPMGLPSTGGPAPTPLPTPPIPGGGAGGAMTAGPPVGTPFGPPDPTAPGPNYRRAPAQTYTGGGAGGPATGAPAGGEALGGGGGSYGGGAGSGGLPPIPSVGGHNLASLGTPPFGPQLGERANAMLSGFAGTNVGDLMKFGISRALQDEAIGRDSFLNRQASELNARALQSAQLQQTMANMPQMQALKGLEVLQPYIQSTMTYEMGPNGQPIAKMAPWVENAVNHYMQQLGVGGPPGGSSLVPTGGGEAGGAGVRGAMHGTAGTVGGEPEKAGFIRSALHGLASGGGAWGGAALAALGTKNPWAVGGAGLGGAVLGSKIADWIDPEFAGMQANPLGYYGAMVAAPLGAYLRGGGIKGVTAAQKGLAGGINDIFQRGKGSPPTGGGGTIIPQAPLAGAPIGGPAGVSGAKGVPSVPTTPTAAGAAALTTPPAGTPSTKPPSVVEGIKARNKGKGKGKAKPTEATAGAAVAGGGGGGLPVRVQQNPDGKFTVYVPDANGITTPYPQRLTKAELESLAKTTGWQLQYDLPMGAEST